MAQNDTGIYQLVGGGWGFRYYPIRPRPVRRSHPISLNCLYITPLSSVIQFAERTIFTLILCVKLTLEIGVNRGIITV